MCISSTSGKRGKKHSGGEWKEKNMAFQVGKVRKTRGDYIMIPAIMYRWRKKTERIRPHCTLNQPKSIALHSVQISPPKFEPNRRVSRRAVWKIETHKTIWFFLFGTLTLILLLTSNNRWALAYFIEVFPSSLLRDFSLSYVRPARHLSCDCVAFKKLIEKW